MADSKDDKELNELKERVKRNLEELVLNKFPKKVLEMEKLIEQKFDAKNQSAIKTNLNIPIPEAPNTGQTPSQTTAESLRSGLDRRVFLFPNGVNPSNEQISQLCDCVKPLLLDFVSDIRQLKFAIQLMVPKVEDGNNFGVQIQESTIRAIRASERQSLSRLNMFPKYYSFRGSIVSWIAKWPHCQDYRRCLQEEDNTFYLVLCLIVRELRDDYVSLNDIIVKNLDKIKNPRPVRDTSIY